MTHQTLSLGKYWKLFSATLKGFLNPKFIIFSKIPNILGGKSNGMAPPVDRITISYRHFPSHQKSRFHFGKFPVVNGRSFSAMYNKDDIW